MPKSSKHRGHKPLEFHTTLYTQFASLDGSPESCLKFASKFGLLGFSDPMGGEPLGDWQQVIPSMAEAIKLSQDNPFALSRNLMIAPLQGILVPSPPDGRLVLRLRPKNLHYGMQLQFILAITSGHAIKECEFCGGWFEAGGDQRRRDARFCSKEHKIAYHNEKKRRASK